MKSRWNSTAKTGKAIQCQMHVVLRSVYYTYVYTKQMQHKKQNQMRFVSTNTSNRTYEMATKQFKMACHQTHTFDSAKFSRFHYLFLYHTY